MVIIWRLFARTREQNTTFQPGAAFLRCLGGKVHVDVVLSPDIAVADCKKARNLSTSLADVVRDLGYIGKTKVYFR